MRTRTLVWRPGKTLTPRLGIVHADAFGRDSLVYDLLEPVRPVVDEMVVSLVARRSFRRVDFYRAPDGHVRVLAPLSHELATWLPCLRQAAGPWAEQVAAMLARAAEGKVGAPTVVTGANRQGAQARVKARKAMSALARERRRRQAADAEREEPDGWSCPTCGGKVKRAGHVRCDACIGADPRQRAEVRGRRGKAIAASRAKDAAWKDGGGQGRWDPDAWHAIRAGLAEVKLAAIMPAAGVTKSTAWSWRTGRSVPHPRHWGTLAELAGVAGEARQ